MDIGPFTIGVSFGRDSLTEKTETATGELLVLSIVSAAAAAATAVDQSAAAAATTTEQEVWKDRQLLRTKQSYSFRFAD